MQFNTEPCIAMQCNAMQCEEIQRAACYKSVSVVFNRDTCYTSVTSVAKRDTCYISEVQNCWFATVASRQPQSTLSWRLWKDQSMEIKKTLLGVHAQVSYCVRYVYICKYTYIRICIYIYIYIYMCMCIHK